MTDEGLTLGVRDEFDGDPGGPEKPRPVGTGDPAFTPSPPSDPEPTSDPAPTLDPAGDQPA